MRIISLTEYGQYASCAHRTRRFNSFIQNSKGNKFVPGFISFAMDAKRLEKPTTQNNINFLRIKLSAKSRAKSIGSFQSITKDFFDQSERTFFYQSEFGPPDKNF